MKSILRSPFIAAILGGVLVALALLVLDVGTSNRTTTIVQQAPLSAANASETRSRSMTPREIYKRVSPGVVHISAQIVQRTQSPFDLGPSAQQGEATGSGIVLDRNGTILTNAHVIQGAIKVTVQFEDKKAVDAKVVGRDQSTDLAVLKVNPDGINLVPLQLGESKQVQVGDPTLAIGNPFGLDRTLTTGVVSALQRHITAPNNFTIDNVIQTDAPINPGNSGGPLLDAAGRVIGINSQIETGGGQGSVGIGFAIPVDTAKQIIPQLQQHGSVAAAFLGLTSLTIDATLSQLNLASDHGALVQSVNSGSPADHAGIHAGSVQANVAGSQIAIGGDIIVSADGKPITSSQDLGAFVSSHKPGDTVKLGVRRKNQTVSVSVKLGTRPNTVKAAAPTG
ncbi:MAG: trypsin-like peptidase domain-containing protein [Solirubrobacteraceae bacterium]